MRTFIAADFPVEIVENIRTTLSYLKAQTPGHDLKWVASENLHLTIKFLGDIAESRLENIKTIFQDELRGQNEFLVTVEGLGFYPNAQHPRVVWFGITPEQTLKQIHRKLDIALQKIDVHTDQRGYSPHLTVARVRRNVDQQTIKKIGETLSKFKVDPLGSAVINQIKLYQSKLTPQGPVYSPLLTMTLNQV